MELTPARCRHPHHGGTSVEFAFQELDHILRLPEPWVTLAGTASLPTEDHQ
jgi:hypothetical protein